MEANISVQFEIPDGVAVAYWIRLEEAVRTPETVSPEEAATVIDSLFKTDPCLEVDEAEEATTSVDEADDSRMVHESSYFTQTAEELYNSLTQAFNLIGYNPCKINQTGDYESDVFIYRSHVDIPYNLIVDDGRVLKTTIERQWIDTFVKVSGDSVTLDYAISGDLAVGAEITGVDGSTVYFETEIESYIRFQFWTTYDRVTIEVEGDAQHEPQPCKCLVFYQEMVSELIVEPPEEDEDAIDQSNCEEPGLLPFDPDSDGGSGDSGDESEDDGTWECYKKVISSTACRCSQTSSGESVQQVVSVPCSDPYAHWSAGGAESAMYASTEQRITYAPCPEEEGNWEGADMEFYLENCCDPPPSDWAPPACREMVFNKTATYSPVIAEDDNATYYPVYPSDGNCGTITHRWNVESKNCCDSEFYEDLEYNEDDSVEIIADYSSGVVFWSGGDSSNPDAGLATITVHGNGFWVNSSHSEKSIQAVGGARIYTEDACGACHITIDDGCSTTKGALKSSTGRWVKLGERSNSNQYPSYCSRAGSFAVGSYTIGAGLIREASSDEINGIYAMSVDGRHQPSPGWPRWAYWYLGNLPTLQGCGLSPCVYHYTSTSVSNCHSVYGATDVSSSDIFNTPFTYLLIHPYGGGGWPTPPGGTHCCGENGVWYGVFAIGGIRTFWEWEC